jgi:DNA-binding response OmpR family regulator
MRETSMTQTEDKADTRQLSCGGKSRILVVDDNEDSANSLAAMFDILGHEASVAFDGVAAVEAAASFKPDVVLLDIGLPKMSGLEVARKIREQTWGQGMFLIAVTGWSDEKDRSQSAAAGFDMHLVKPIDPAVLEKLLAQQPSRAIAG